MSLSAIVGQSDIKNKIKTAIETDTLAHAYIFTGEQGLGKKLMAQNIARTVLCTGNHKPCGACLACKTIEAGTNPDIKYIQGEGNSISVDEIREVQSDSSIRPMYSGKKVYIVADGDRMTKQAQNALLKTLEEPPEYCLIIITTSQPDKLLETIRSRTLKLTFRRNTQEELLAILKNNNVELTDENRFILDYCDGIPGKALEAAASEELIKLRETLLEYLFDLTGKAQKVFQFIEFLNQNKQSIDWILNLIIVFYRDIYLLTKNVNEEHLINSDKKGMIIKCGSSFGAQRALKCINAVELAQQQIKSNANFELVLEVMLMEIIKE